jgi:hypothetical protein
METLTLFMEGIRVQTQGTPRLTNAFRFVPSYGGIPLEDAHLVSA